MIKRVAIATVVFSMFIAFACYRAFGIAGMYSSLVGSGAILLNLFGIWFCWKLVFLKKSIALAALVIIFKYLILGLILYKFFQTDWLDVVSFVSGLSALLLGIVTSVFFKPNSNEI